MTPARCEIWWHEPPDDDPRPVLVLTRNEAIRVLNRVLAVPVTRSKRDIPTHVHLDERDGLREPCALTVDNTSLVLKGHLVRRIATLGPAKMAEVCRALNVAVSC